MLIDSAPVLYVSSPARRHTIARRAIVVLAVLFATGAWAAVPAVAAGGPLLSGYGGPGEGSQQILGSALLGGPAGSGSGTGGAGGGGAAASGGESLGSKSSATGGAGAGASSPRRVPGAAARRGRGSSAAGRSLTGAAEAPGSSAATSLTGAAGSDTLGLSSEDVTYILIAIGALVLTGALTRRLAHRSR